jgi:hypothetical protein
MSETNLLHDLYDQHRHQLPDEYPWENESHRVLELIALLVTQTTRTTMEFARKITQSFSDFGFLVPDGAESLTDMFVRAGVDHAIAASCASQICEVIADINKSKRSPQQIIREHAMAMLADFESVLPMRLISPTARHELLATWLETTMHLPIAYESDSITEYCKHRAISFDQLVREADATHMNLSVIDDLTELWSYDRDTKPK